MSKLSLLRSTIAQQVLAARAIYFDNQFDINDAWNKYHGNMNYREFAEDYIAALTSKDGEGKLTNPSN